MKRLLFALALALPLTAAPKINDLRWMSGHWSATIDGVEMEEQWSEPKGGMLLGMHRDVRANGKASFEFFRIAETKDGIVYFAQPGGRAATPFTLTESREGRAVFANPAHDFPQRIIYTLRDGRLCARVEGEAQAAEEWCWAKQRSAH
jgi:Domain of unknown function (DUF6265)